jgi:hypothetical protein
MLVSATWIMVTFLTSPVEEAHSNQFFRVVGTRVKAISKVQWLYWGITCFSFFLIKIGWWALLCGDLLTGVLSVCLSSLGLLMVVFYIRKRA